MDSHYCSRGCLFTELGFRVGSRVGFRVGFSRWIFELDFELDFEQQERARHTKSFPKSCQIVRKIHLKPGISFL